MRPVTIVAKLADTIVGLARGEAGHALFEHDAELEAGEDQVVRQVFGGTTADRLVVREQFVARRHAGVVDVGRSVGRLVVGRIRDERPAEIEQRIADRCHLPVDDGCESCGRAVAEHDVRKLVVAVQDAGLVDLGPVPTEPIGGFVDAGELACLHTLEERQPPVDLPVVESLGAPEPFESGCLPVDAREPGNAVDELDREPAACVEIGVEGWSPTDLHRRPAVDTLGQVERPAQHLDVVAHGVKVGVGNIGVGERGEHPMLAAERFVATLRGDVGRPAQHVFDAAAFDGEQFVLGSATQAGGGGQLTKFPGAVACPSTAPGAPDRRARDRPSRRFPLVPSPENNGADGRRRRPPRWWATAPIPRP